MTPIQKLTRFLYDNEYWMDEALMAKCDELLKEEELMIKRAIMYALDEDGHTGDWKAEFANRYYEVASTK